MVLSRARCDFHANRSLSGPQQAEAITIGYTQLDNLTAQVEHMRAMLAADMLVHRSGMVEWRRDEEAQKAAGGERQAGAGGEEATAAGSEKTATEGGHAAAAISKLSTAGTNRAPDSYSSPAPLQTAATSHGSR